MLRNPGHPSFMGVGDERRPRPPKEETPQKRRERLLAQRHCMQAIWRPKIPEARMVDYEHFKNRYDSEKPDHAIEALVGAPDLRSSIQDEERRRREMNHTSPQDLPMLAAYEMMEVLAENSGVVKDLGESSKSESHTFEARMPSAMNATYIRRVRVQSQPVLGYLTKLSGEGEHSVYRSWPRTFFRPFKSLVYFQQKMKEILGELEDKWKAAEAQGNRHETQPDLQKNVGAESKSTAQHEESDTESETSKSLASFVSRDENNSRMMDKVMDSTEALRDMRCYVDFVDREIIPHYNMLQGNEPRSVSFDDLWCLFRVGELVYAPITSNNTNDRGQELWRLYRVSDPDPKTDKRVRTMYWGLQDNLQAYTEFEIYCYHIGHDGSSYGAVRRRFSIESFLGERDIQSLEVYPFRLAANRDKVLETLRAQGLKFQSTFEQRHQAYNNWSLTMQMTPPENVKDVQRLAKKLANILFDERMTKVEDMQTDNIASEFIESHVIVDLEEAFKANPRWRPRFHKPRILKFTPNVIEEDWPTQVWSDKSRRKLVVSIPEVVQIMDGIELRQRRDNLLNDDIFLRHRAKGATHWDRLGQLPEKLRQDDLVLLPRRSFAYTLRERKFVAIDVNYLKPIIQEEGVFQRLKILKEYKDIVRGLVSSHFQKKELERLFADNSLEILGQDLIQGKGKGLVILLHGVPGVGKTATAEAVAMETNKPLFTMTCGDLGLLASEVESSLTNIFRLAHKWDCVLLLDEADVFLSQRSRFDMKRNSLVSVFLRVLEYYNGLLFLTTNRVGTIDEAFKSRIHMSLYYPLLDKVQTKAIFGFNMKRLSNIEHQRSLVTGKPELVIKEDEILSFAAQHFDSNHGSGGRWNGRQIRNAFQIASGLAYYHFSEGINEARKQGVPPPDAPVLDRNLFEKVQIATQNFDKYMREAKGVDDAERAYQLGERADHFRNSQPPPSPSYVTSTPQGNSSMPNAFASIQTAQSSHKNHGGSYTRPGQVYTSNYTTGGGPEFHHIPSNSATQFPSHVGPQDPSHPSLHLDDTSSQFNNMESRGDIGAPSQRLWNFQISNQGQPMQAGSSLGHEHLSPMSAASSRLPGYGTAPLPFRTPTVADEEDLYG